MKTSAVVKRSTKGSYAIIWIGIVLAFSGVANVIIKFMPGYHLVSVILIVVGVILWVIGVLLGSEIRLDREQMETSDVIGLRLISSNGKVVDRDFHRPKDALDINMQSKIPGVVWEHVKKLAAVRGIDELEAWRMIIKNGMAIMTAVDDGHEVYIDGQKLTP